MLKRNVLNQLMIFSTFSNILRSVIERSVTVILCVQFYSLGHSTSSHCLRSVILRSVSLQLVILRPLHNLCCEDEDDNYQ